MSQIPLFGVRDTSIEAYYHEALPRLSKKQELVLAYLRARGASTNKEISEGTGININATTPTVYALRKKGLVLEHEKRVCRITGNRVYTWKVK